MGELVCEMHVLKSRQLARGRGPLTLSNSGAASNSTNLQAGILIFGFQPVELSHPEVVASIADGLQRQNCVGKEHTSLPKAGPQIAVGAAEIDPGF